jgi:hypothetical protein
MVVEPGRLGSEEVADRGALRERPMEAQPFPEVDGVELERPTASWNSRSTNAFVRLPQGRSSMVRADGHFPGSHGARKPLMSSKEGSGSWRSS